MEDKEIKNLIKEEKRKQARVINLIASENFVSKDILEALGSVFVNKYAEGYPGKRYYGGNKIVDKLEKLCQERALKLFGLHRAKSRWHVNVQPYSGSPANLAVYSALVPRKGKIMGMTLEMGGHLTHGQKVSITGKLWKQVPYGVDPVRNKKSKISADLPKTNRISNGVDRQTERLDYNQILKIAKKEKPAIIIAGFTTYSRIIDFKKFRQIADACRAYLMVDMAHIAGLVAGGAHPSPFPYADIVTTTTHKTLRGPRAAIIFCKKELAQKIDKAVFPGLQGGPHINQIAAVAVCLKEAMQPKFKKYAKQVVKNTKVLASELKKKGWRIISGGTDTHLFLVDTFARGIGGKEASEKLEKVGIIVNKNTIPFDTRKPTDPSGIRLGTAAVTTLGMKERDMVKIAGKIDKILRS